VQTAEAATTRPYLIRAIYEWCTDNGFTPYLAVQVDQRVQVPMEHVKDNEIVLNISFDATSGLKLGNEWIEFKARFSGAARDILVPVDHVLAIYARENGQGMAFPTVKELEAEARQPTPTPTPSTANTADKVVKLVSTEVTAVDPEPKPPTPSGTTRPALKRIK
jgi:stringent starvation protein B